MSQASSASDGSVNSTVRRPRKKRFTATSSRDESSSDDSSSDEMFNAVLKIISTVPMPSLARAPVDPLEELSARIVMLPAYNGRLLLFFKTLSALGHEGVLLIAKGILHLPPESAGCYGTLSKIVLPHKKKARSEAKKQLLKSLEPPEVTSYGSPEDDQLRIQLSHVFAFVFQQIILANDALRITSINTSFSCPHSKEPSISLFLYIQRTMRYLPATVDTFIVALIYIDRVLSFNPEVRLTIYNAHRLFITAVLIASKYLDDLFYTNVFFSKVGGISPHEMNRLEIEFLAAVRFSLYVKLEMFQYYRDIIMNLVGVCRLLPLNIPVPSSACVPPSCMMHSSYSVIDELFIHIESERRRVDSLRPTAASLLELNFPSTLTPQSSPKQLESKPCGECSQNATQTLSQNGVVSSEKASSSSFRRTASFSSRCSTEASSGSSSSSRSSSASQDFLNSCHPKHH